MLTLLFCLGENFIEFELFVFRRPHIRTFYVGALGVFSGFVKVAEGRFLR